MRKIVIIAVFVVGAMLTNSFAESESHMKDHMMSGPGYGEAMGPGMMGPGMMGYGGCGMMGPGMMGYGGCGMMGPGMMGYGMMEHHQMMHGSTPGMMWKCGNDEYKKFLDDTRELRKSLHSLKFEYFEAMRNPDEDGKKLAEIEKNMREIQKKINDAWRR